MPAGPAPTIASRSLVMRVLSKSLTAGIVRSTASARRAWSAGAVCDGLGEAGERLAHRPVGNRGEGVDRLARPLRSEVEGRPRGVVLAQGGERLVEDRRVGTVGDLRD